MRALLVSLLLVACGSEEVSPTTEWSGVGGAAVASGGAVAASTGGANQASTGGATATQVTTVLEFGGMLGSGGTVATGGAATGVQAATGGSRATVGTQTGGSATGGSKATGGVTATGGSATGGTSAGGAMPIGIAGAAGHSCPEEISSLRAQLDLVFYDQPMPTGGLACRGTSTAKCIGYSGQSSALITRACSMVWFASHDQLAHPGNKLDPGGFCAITIVVSSDLKLKLCVAHGDREVGLATALPPAAAAFPGAWIVNEVQEDFDAITVKPCKRSCADFGL